jgi:hypothetical protein
MHVIRVVRLQSVTGTSDGHWSGIVGIAEIARINMKGKEF